MKTNLKSLSLVVALTVLTAFSAQAQWQVAAKAIAVKGLQTAVKHISAEKLQWFLGGMSHTWWYCRYEDGTTVYNNFRSYRDGNNVWSYFTGHTSGDCDSKDEAGNTFCYRGTMDAQRYVNEHGSIVDIGVMGSDQHYQSAWNF